MTAVHDVHGQKPEFADFVAGDGMRLRRVLVAYFGVDVGNDVCADALEYGWRHWDRVGAMDNPTGYLFRVGQTAARRHRRWQRRVTLPAEFRPGDAVADSVLGEPGLHEALAAISPEQRACVVMVKVYDWTYQQTADALEMPLTSVRNHLHRGLTALRAALEPISNSLDMKDP
jgi:DNA-directed RNA polymerase specialized sigma24 family protein